MCFWRCCSGGGDYAITRRKPAVSQAVFFVMASRLWNSILHTITALFPIVPYPACTFFHEVVFTRYYFSTYLAGVPSEQSRAENVTSECRPLIGRREEEERETRGWVTRATPSQKSKPAFFRNLGTTATVRYPTVTRWWLSTWTVLDWYMFSTVLNCFFYYSFIKGCLSTTGKSTCQWKFTLQPFLYL